MSALPAALSSARHGGRSKRDDRGNRLLTQRRTSSAQVSLERALSKLGVSSRSQARAMIAGGRVSVNGSVTRNPAAWIDLRRDRVAVDGHAVSSAVKRYAVMNKPVDVVTTRSDERGRRTVVDLLPPEYSECFPVGRLDKDTSGLLIFTNDTEFGESVTSPLKKVPKTYRVRLDRTIDVSGLRRLEGGVVLESGLSFLPASVTKCKIDNEYLFEIVEGKNRQIRRMVDAVGRRVLSLCRVKIGGIELGNLPEGKVRALTAEEVQSLYKRRSHPRERHAATRR